MHNSPFSTPSLLGVLGGWRKLVFSLFALAITSTAFAGSGFSSIIVFGDSVSDTGRLFRLTHGGFPPRVAYFDGRQSNGPVWVEYLAEKLGRECRLKDYAVVGALIAPSAAVPTGNVWSDTFPGLDGTSLSRQVDHYLCDTRNVAEKDALYILQGGANDLIGPISALLFNPPATTDEFLQKVNDIATPTVTNIGAMIRTLRKHGAQHIAVVNVPDFGKAPRLVGFGPVASATVSLIVQIVNEDVAAKLDEIDAASQDKIARIDMFGVVDAIVADPAHYGFTNVTGQFMTLDLATSKVTYAAEKNRAVQWLFWDDLHPTTRGHEFLAQSALATLRAAFPAIHGGHFDDSSCP